MRVLFIVNEFPVLSETFISQQALGLLDRGIDVDVLAINGRPGEPEPKRHNGLSRFESEGRILAAIQPPTGRVARIGRTTALLAQSLSVAPGRTLKLLNPKGGRAALSLRLLFTGRPFLKHDSLYDIIHCQFGPLARPALDLRRQGLLSGKVVVHFRGYDLAIRQGPALRRYYKDIFASADGFLSNSEHFARKVVALGCDPENIKLVSSPIALDLFPYKERTPPRDKRIELMIIGRLVEKKGIDDGLRALRSLKARGIDAHLTIIGEGPLGAPLKQLEADLGLTGHVDWRGWQTAEEIARLLEACDIVLAPSVTAASGDQDGPVNTLKEAMASGTPIIGTNHGGIPELLQDGRLGDLVPERSPEALADAVIALCRNDAAWGTRTRAARAHVETHFTVASTTDRLLFHYQTLLEGSGLRGRP